MPVRHGGQEGQDLISGHASLLGNITGFFLGNGGGYGTSGVTWGQEWGEEG